MLTPRQLHNLHCTQSKSDRFWSCICCTSSWWSSDHMGWRPSAFDQQLLVAIWCIPLKLFVVRCYTTLRIFRTSGNSRQTSSGNPDQWGTEVQLLHGFQINGNVVKPLGCSQTGFAMLFAFERFVHLHNLGQSRWQLWRCTRATKLQKRWELNRWAKWGLAHTDGRLFGWNLNDFSGWSIFEFWLRAWLNKGSLQWKLLLDNLDLQAAMGAYPVSCFIWFHDSRIYHTQTSKIKEADHIISSHKMLTNITILMYLCPLCIASRYIGSFDCLALRQLYDIEQLAAIESAFAAIRGPTLHGRSRTGLLIGYSK